MSFQYIWINSNKRYNKTKLTFIEDLLVAGTTQNYFDLLTYAIPKTSRDRYNYDSHFVDVNTEAGGRRGGSMRLQKGLFFIWCLLKEAKKGPGDSRSVFCEEGWAALEREVERWQGGEDGRGGEAVKGSRRQPAAAWPGLEARQPGRSCLQRKPSQEETSSVSGVTRELDTEIRETLAHRSHLKPSRENI